MKNKIQLIGCGLSPDNLPDNCKKLILNSDILIGGSRLLDFFPNFSGTRIPIKSDLNQIISQIKKLYKRNKKISILASGDSLFFGIGRIISSHFSPDQLVIYPNITAFQYLFAKIKIPWDDAEFFSIHGRKKINLHYLLSIPLAVIYCDNRTTTTELAKNIIRKFPCSSQRQAILAENLGSSKEKITHATLAKIAKLRANPLSILLLLPPRNSITDMGLPLGLPDDSFIYDKNLITHPEVRAIAISKLKIGPGIMWDIGAGSGSVSIEAASLCKYLHVHAVEKNKNRAESIKNNLENFSIPNVSLHIGKAEIIIQNLPRPRSIFIGGGGDRLNDILKISLEKLLPNGRIVIPSVMLNTKRIVADFIVKYPSAFDEHLFISIARSQKISSSYMLRANNPIELFVLKK